MPDLDRFDDRDFTFDTFKNVESSLSKGTDTFASDEVFGAEVKATLKYLVAFWVMIIVTEVITSHVGSTFPFRSLLQSISVQTGLCMFSLLSNILLVALPSLDTMNKQLVSVFWGLQVRNGPLIWVETIVSSIVFRFLEISPIVFSHHFFTYLWLWVEMIMK